MILIVGPLDFPTRNAAAQMMEGVARSFQQNGYSVRIIGRATDPQHIGTSLTISPGVEAVLPSPSTSKINFPTTFRAISRLSSVQRPRAVLLYNPDAALLAAVLASKSRLTDRLIAVATEWYDAPDFSHAPFRAIAKQIDTNLRMRHLLHFVDGLIVSSTYLGEYYRRKPTVIIPGVGIPAGPIEPRSSDDHPGKVLLLYAGNPFRREARELQGREMKDRLDVAIDILTDSSMDDVSFAFEIYGITREDYLLAVPRHRDILSGVNGRRIHFMGAREASEVRTRLGQADYTILIRDESRLTRAGFPTKVVESVTAGVPPIVSETGDIALYIRDGENGVILPNGHEERVQCVKSTILNHGSNHDAMADRCMTESPFEIARVATLLNTIMASTPQGRNTP
ncbi:glycosyltransferase [Nostocoides veronense]